LAVLYLCGKELNYPYLVALAQNPAKEILDIQPFELQVPQLAVIEIESVDVNIRKNNGFFGFTKSWGDRSPRGSSVKHHIHTISEGQDIDHVGKPHS